VGHTFVPLAACGGATPTCAQGACVCTDGAMTCADATTPQVCTGGVQVAQAACPPNTPACQQGACACAEGALSCAGNTPQLCAAGVLLPQAACPTRTLCALGDCVVPQTFSAGSQSTCAVLGGKVECWGDNSNGQLGDGTYSPHALPTELPFFQGVSVLHVGTSGEHSCAVEADGTVLCWGYNGYGQLGDGTTTSHTAPVAAAGVTSAVEVAVGDYSTCALRSDGTVLCWGSNSNGQLGNNTLVSSSVPVAVPHLTQVTQVQAGGSDYCAVKQDHSVWCWGYSYFGQTGSLTNPQLVPTPVAGLEATEVALGLQTSCALSTDAGEVDCWGYGQQGQLGISPALFQQPVPQPVGLRDAVAVAVGTSHVCAAKSDGTVWCWGDNSAGQLGDGTTAAHNVPAQVPGLQGIVALSSHASHTCAQDTAGALHCWGDDQKGQLGDGLTSARFQATAVLGLSGASAVSAGGNFTCALLADGGDVQCWGTDRDNELGDFSYQNRAVPGPVPGLVGVAQLAAGGNHACARLSDGSVQCWGGNSASQLADSTIGAPVTGVAGASSVAASTSKTIYSYSSSSSGCYDDCGASCAVSAGLVQCWGDNRFGQIGNGSFGTSNVPPTAVLGVSGVTQVVLGAQHGCALTGAGTVSCWGDNTYGQLGDGTLASRAAAGQVPSLSGVVALSAGDVHTCALLTDQTVQCWGNNDYGQLGSFNYSLSPLPVDALTGAVEVAAGARHTCARLSDGTVSCWGTNTSGQLGNVLSSFSAATPVTGLTTATQITAGGFTDQYTDVGSQGHACALLADTTVWCWGLDSSGQVGDGLFGYRATPVDVIVH
jgi:alpha-tubulin suppressor-like RCC1 family protein